MSGQNERKMKKKRIKILVLNMIQKVDDIKQRKTFYILAKQR